MENIEVLSLEQHAKELVNKLENIKHTSDLKQKEHDIFVEKSNEILNLMIKANSINDDLKFEIGNTFNKHFFENFKDVANQKNQLSDLISKIEIIFKDSNRKQDTIHDTFVNGMNKLNLLIDNVHAQSLKETQEVKTSLASTLTLNKEIKETTDTTLEMNRVLRKDLEMSLALNKELLSANILLLEKLDVQLEKSQILETSTQKVLAWIEEEGSVLVENSRVGLFGKKK